MNQKGVRYEDLAASYLLSKGFYIIVRNFSCKYGEIDIIAKKDEILHFIEVKGGINTFGDPAYRVNAKKLHKIMKVGNFFISTHKNINFEEVQIDVISVTNSGEIHYYPSQRL